MISSIKPAGFLMMAGALMLIPVFSVAAQEKVGSLSGSAEAGYRYRSDSKNTDQDWLQRLYLEGFAPWDRLGTGSEFGFVFSGVLQEDFSGDQEDDAQVNPFREIADSYDQPAVGLLYLAYGELNGPGTLELARLGRQELLDLEPVAFDGGLVRLRPKKKSNLSLTAFGGLPANLFETDREGDWLVGAYLDWRVLRTLSLRAGYLGLHDRVRLLDGNQETLDENLAIAQAAWRPRLGDDLIGRVTARETGVRDFTLRGSHRDQAHDFNLSAYYQGLYQTRELAPLTEDPFSILLGEYRPYNQGGVTFYKGIGERLGVEAGAMVRGLRDRDAANPYNHSFQRYLLTLFINKVPLSRSEFMIGADYWVAPFDEVETQTIHAEFLQRFGPRGKFRVGTAFDLYKVDQFTAEERERVQTYYTDLTLPFLKKLSVIAGYSFEDSSLREVDTIQARLRYDF